MIHSQTPAADLAPPRDSLADTLLRIGLLALLAYACVRIALPFVSLLLWSVVLAVMLYPLHVRLSRRLGNRWSATVIGVVGIALILVPTVLLATSLISSAQWLISGLQNHTLTVPPPPPRVAELPLIGHKLSEFWGLAATNVPAMLAKYGKPLSGAATWVAGLAGGLAAGELAFLLSFGIAAVLVAYGKSCTALAQRLLEFMTGSRGNGPRLVTLTAATIRGVAVGVVGVAAIQSLLLGVGFFLIGLPGAGLLVLVVFLLGIVQVPATLLTLPIIAYAFATESVMTALIFAAWTLVAGLSDNVLKPLMLGRGLEVPMPVILIGVIGGMIADGLLGLFVGPVILAVGYVLLVDWLRLHPDTTADTPSAGTPP